VYKYTIQIHKRRVSPIAFVLYVIALLSIKDMASI